MAHHGFRAAGRRLEFGNRDRRRSGGHRRQRQAILDDRLPQLFVRVHDDVSGIEQPRLGQMRDRTAASVGAQDGISE